MGTTGSIRLAAHLYTFGRPAWQAADLTATVQALAELGYAGFEAMGAPSEALALAIPCCGLHTASDGVADLSALTAALGRLQCRDVVVSGPLGWHDRSAENYQRTATTLVAAARSLAGDGIRLHYHNHDFEFLPFPNGQTPMDVLEHTWDPALVDWCLDLGWVYRAGLDGLAYLQAHRHRVGPLHLRDFAGAQSVVLGAGDIPQAPLLAAIAALPGPRWLVVEQDPQLDALACHRQSLAHLRALSAD